MAKFSLSTLLIFIAIIALVIALVKTRSRIEEVSAEVTVIQQTHNLLQPAQTDLIGSVLVSGFSDQWRRWRIRLPNDSRFVLRYATNQLPAKPNLPSSGNDLLEMPQGEFFLTFGVKPKNAYAENTEFFVYVSDLSGDVKSESLFELRNLDLTQFGSFNFPEEVAGQKDAGWGSSDQPLVLFRQRQLVKDELEQSQTAPGPANGVMLWIERTGQ